MKILSRVPENDAQCIHENFPSLLQILERESDGGMEKIAISVFDHWLRDEAEWHLLDCYEGSERSARDQKFERHWGAIFDLTPAYTLRYRGRWPNKACLVLKKYTSREGFLRQSRFNKDRSPSQFLVLPELDCIYAAGWSDTNILYFGDMEKAKPIMELATNAGLFMLRFDS